MCGEREREWERGREKERRELLQGVWGGCEEGRTVGGVVMVIVLVIMCVVVIV